MRTTRNRLTGPCFRRVWMIAPEGLILMSDEFHFRIAFGRSNWLEFGGKWNWAARGCSDGGNCYILVVVDYTDCPFSVLQLISSCFVGYQSAD